MEKQLIIKIFFYRMLNMIYSHAGLGSEFILSEHSGKFRAD